MDPTSKLVAFGAAGVGKESYWANQITFPGILNGTAYSRGVDVNESGNAVLGNAFFYSGPGLYGYIAAFSNNGDLQFQKSFYKTGSDNLDLQTRGNAVGIDQANNIYALLTYGGFSPPGGVLKFNSAGNLQWIYKRGLGSGFGLDGIKFDSSNNLFIGGAESASGTSDYHGVLRLDSSGNFLGFNRLTYGYSLLGFGKGVSLSNSQYVVVGSNNDKLVLSDFSGGSYNGYSVEYTNIDSGPNGSRGGVTVDSSGNVYFSGITRNSPQRACVLKLASDLVPTWLLTFSSAAANYGVGVTIDKNDNIYTAVRTDSDGNRIIVYKISSAGAVIWERSIKFTQTTGISTVSSIKCNSKGLWFAVGFADKQVLVKFPTDGSITGTYGSYQISSSNYLTTTLTTSITRTVSFRGSTSSTPSSTGVGETINTESFSASKTLLG